MKLRLIPFIATFIVTLMSIVFSLIFFKGYPILIGLFTGTVFISNLLVLNKVEDAKQQQNEREVSNGRN